MFAYCNNNPGNYVDPEGMCKNTFSIYLKADCGEEDRPHSKYYIENEAIRKTVQVLEAAIVNWDAQIAIGLGYYAEFDVLEVLGIWAGVRYDLITIGYRQGEFYAVQSFFSGVEGTLFKVLSFDFADDGVRNISFSEPIEPWKEDTSNDIYTIAGVGGYLYGGGRAYIGLDIISLTDDLDRIFN